MSQDRAVKLAMELMRLGVSRAGAAELLAFPHDIIERQLRYLPYRKAKRPSAFIVDAIRHDYSPPKEAFYAPPPTQPAQADDALDEDPERAAGPPNAFAQGHGTPDPARAPAPDLGLEPGGAIRDLDIP